MGAFSQVYRKKEMIFIGMPVITPGTGTRRQAITDLVESVALEDGSVIIGRRAGEKRF